MSSTTLSPAPSLTTTKQKVGLAIAGVFSLANIIVSTLTGLQAFFVDVPMFVQALVALSVLLTVPAVVLMFSSDRRPTPISD